MITGILNQIRKTRISASDTSLIRPRLGGEELNNESSGSNKPANLTGILNTCINSLAASFT